MISAARVRELLNYNPDSGEFRWAVDRTGQAKAGTIAGRLESRGYRQISIDGRRYMAHRLAWLYVNGEPPREEVDHINGQRDDNRIVNLNAVSSDENKRNKRIYRNSPTRNHGIRPTSRGVWHAYISNKFIGSFKKIEDAIAARQALEAANGYHANHGRR